MKVHTILLIPAEGDPLGLLLEGPCGARPPVAHWRLCNDCGGWWGEYRSEYFCGACGTRTDRKHNKDALALVWEDYVVRLGAATLAEEAGFSCDLIDLWLTGLLKHGGEYDDMPRVSERVERLGSVLLLDADGNEETR